jgi:hypothetical protein
MDPSEENSLGMPMPMHILRAQRLHRNRPHQRGIDPAAQSDQRLRVNPHLRT